MAEKKKAEPSPEELEKLIQSLAGGPLAAGMPQAPPVPAGGQIISPVDIQKLLKILRDLPLDLSSETLQKVDPLRREIANVVSTLQKLSTELVSRQLEDGLSWIYHPIYGESVAAARIRQLIHVLAASVRRMWYYIAENYDKMSTSELAEAVETAELATKLSFLVISDTWSKIMTLFFANAPPSTRPPLVNAAIGYEIVEFGSMKGKTVKPPSLTGRPQGRGEK